jgi:hypothetical protein
LGAEIGGLNTNSLAEGLRVDDEVRVCPFVDLAVFASALGTANGKGGRFDVTGAVAAGEECCFFASGKSCVEDSSSCWSVPETVSSIL